MQQKRSRGDNSKAIGVAMGLAMVLDTGIFKSPERLENRRLTRANEKLSSLTSV